MNTGNQNSLYGLIMDDDLVDWREMTESEAEAADVQQREATAGKSYWVRICVPTNLLSYRQMRALDDVISYLETNERNHYDAQPEEERGDHIYARATVLQSILENHGVSNEVIILKLVSALSALVIADNCNYDTRSMRYVGLFERARLAIQEAEDAMSMVRRAEGNTLTTLDVLEHVGDAIASALHVGADTIEIKLTHEWADAILNLLGHK